MCVYGGTCVGGTAQEARAPGIPSLARPRPLSVRLRTGKTVRKTPLKMLRFYALGPRCVGFYCLVHAHTHSNRKRSVFRDAFLEFLVIGGEDSLCLFVRFVNQCESAN